MPLSDRDREERQEHLREERRKWLLRTLLGANDALRWCVLVQVCDLAPEAVEEALARLVSQEHHPAGRARTTSGDVDGQMVGLPDARQSPEDDAP